MKCLQPPLGDVLDEWTIAAIAGDILERRDEHGPTWLRVEPDGTLRVIAEHGDLASFRRAVDKLKNATPA